MLLPYSPGCVGGALGQVDCAALLPDPDLDPAGGLGGVAAQAVVIVELRALVAGQARVIEGLQARVAEVAPRQAVAEVSRSW